MVTLTMTLPAASGIEVVNCAASGTATGAAKAAAPQRMYVTYDAIHSAIANSLGMLENAGWATPDYLVAISGGGAAPWRPNCHAGTLCFDGQPSPPAKRDFGVPRMKGHSPMLRAREKQLSRCWLARPPFSPPYWAPV
jgi:hypothetical protein